MDDKIKAFLERTPKVKAEDIREINGLFYHYVFRRRIDRKVGEIWTSCCGKHELLPMTHPFWAEKHVGEPPRCYGKVVQSRREPGTVECPLCGELCKPKDLGRSGRRENLEERHRAVIFRWDGESLWAISGEAMKNYGWAGGLTATPVWRGCGLYRFGPEEAEWTETNYYYETVCVKNRRYQDFRPKALPEPFRYDCQYGMGYDVLGMEEIGADPRVRYCDWRNNCDGGGAIRYLWVAHAFPRQVEMLEKLGFCGAVKALAERGKKHAATLNWGAADVRSFWRLREWKAYLREVPEEKRDIEHLEMYRRLQRSGEVFSLRDAVKIREELQDYTVKSVYEAAKGHGRTPGKALRYLLRQGGRLGRVAQEWIDYVRMGDTLGYRMERENVLFPAELGEAHDRAVDESNARREEIRLEEQRRREAAAAEKYRLIREALEKRYAYRAGGLAVLVPEDAAQIRHEGAELRHCVGGYAERHLAGQCVILFLRREKEIDTPWITIEMRGNEMVQIHGYRNEGIHTREGRFAPDPAEVYAWFLGPWLDWIRQGSRRDKAGKPVIKETKGAKAG